MMVTHFLEVLFFFIVVPFLIRRRACPSFKWIANPKEVEFSEIRVRGVNHPDVMLTEKGGKMGIGDEISTNGEPPGNFPINFQEAVQLRQYLYPGQIQEGFQVAQSFIGRERR